MGTAPINPNVPSTSRGTGGSFSQEVAAPAHSIPVSGEGNPVQLQLQGLIASGHTSTPLKRPTDSHTVTPAEKLLRLTSGMTPGGSVVSPAPDLTPQAKATVVIPQVQAPAVTPLARAIVDIECLAELFKTCRHCNCDIPSNFVTVRTIGTGLSIEWKCLSADGCKKTGKWSSQGQKHAKPSTQDAKMVYVGNLDFCTAIPTACMTYAIVAKFAYAMKLLIPSENSYFQYQRVYVNPSVQKEMDQQFDDLHEEIAERDMLELAMDGRYTSVGHTADKCTVSTLDPATSKVIWTESLSKLPKTDTEYCATSNMEARCVGSSLDALMARHPDKVALLCTDGSTSISGLMRKEKYAAVKHCLDPWHGKKSMEKAFMKILNGKGCESLRPWQRKFGNHWMHCSRVGALTGDPKLAVESFQSFYFHIQGQHAWKKSKDPFSVQFKKLHSCTHKRLTREQEKNTPYLQKGDPALEPLKKLLSHPRTVKAMMKCAENIYSSGLESYHNVVRMFAPKRLRFQMASYLTRVYLAIMHYNENEDRPVVLDGDGREVHYIQHHKTRSGPKAVVKAKKTGVTYDYVDAIKARVLQTWETLNNDDSFKISEQKGAPLEKFLPEEEVDVEQIEQYLDKREELRVDRGQMEEMQARKLGEFHKRLKNSESLVVDGNDGLLAPFRNVENAGMGLDDYPADSDEEHSIELGYFE